MMRGLLVKDLLMLRKVMLTAAVPVLILIPFFGLSGMWISVYMILIFVGAATPLLAVLEDAKTGWRRYAAALPVSREEMVRVRFLETVGMTAVAAIVAAMMRGVMEVFGFGASQDLFTGLFTGILLFSGMAVICCSAALAGTYYLGEKSAGAMFVLAILLLIVSPLPYFMISVLALHASLPQLFATIESYSLVPLVIAFPVVLVLYWLSVRRFQSVEL